ncbi:MAG: hypothetical protein PHW96_04635 [Candidatus Nanoarchaeia archaeon]|nr:hypothetical protein [Candidatus Nanoarchaeia archaeon]
MISKTIIKLSEIEDNNWGAEYYHPEKLRAIKKLSKFKENVNYYFQTAKKTYSLKDDEDKIVNLQNVRYGFIDTFSPEQSKSNKKLVKQKDIIISKLRPYLKEIGYVTDEFDGSFVSTEFIILREKIKKDERYTLIPFLFTEDVQKILFWSQQGTNHPRFNEKVLLNIGFPDISENVKNKIKQKLEQAYGNYKKARELYKKAENILNEKLCIKKIDVNNSKTFIKSFSETLVNNRIDSEYYKPEYESYVNHIQKIGFITIKDKYLKDKNFKPKDEKRYNYIELADIKQSLGLVESFTSAYGIDLPTRARRKVNKGDVIISSVEGSLNSSALILKEQDGYLCSNGFYVLNIKDSYYPEFLIILMKNKIIQSLLKKGCSGTILTTISKEELKKIPLPNIDKESQKEVVLLVKKSNELYTNARNLLNETIAEMESKIKA